MPTDDELFSETCGGSCKPVKMPELTDVNTLDLHKGEKSLEKTVFHMPSFAIGVVTGGITITLVIICVILIRSL